MKALIVTLALATGAWFAGGTTATAGDVHFVRGGYRGHHRGHHHHYHHGHHGHHHYHHGYGGYGYGGYPFYGGTYYRGPSFQYSPYYSPYAWRTPYYGFRMYGPSFSFGYYGY